MAARSKAKDVFENYNPATGELIGEVASGGAAEIDAAVAAAREAFPKWANTPAKERARLMRRLGELIDRNVPHWRNLRPSTPACRSTRRRTY
ncbi:aldehyde dehydrogenase family protein [Pseudomonas aeruginosa]